VTEKSVPNLIQAFDLEAIVASLRMKAGQVKVKLPRDAALYIARNLRSNARAMESALMRLIAFSSTTGTAITLAYTQRVLKNFIDAHAGTGTVDPFQRSLSQQLVSKEAKVRPQGSTSADRQFVFCLLKIRDGRKTSRVRHELEVNMREGERERLARRDGYERDLERRAKKRKQG
jgi:hypothetical protein